MNNSVNQRSECGEELILKGIIGCFPFTKKVAEIPIRICKWHDFSVKLTGTLPGETELLKRESRFPNTVPNGNSSSIYRFASFAARFQSFRLSRLHASTNGGFFGETSNGTHSSRMKFPTTISRVFLCVNSYGELLTGCSVKVDGYWLSFLLYRVFLLYGIRKTAIFLRFSREVLQP